jgi:AraC family transcriptional regulator
VVRAADFSVVFAPSPSATHGSELAASVLGKTLSRREDGWDPLVDTRFSHSRPAVFRSWSGRLFLWPGRALWLGHAARTGVHAHHALQVCVALEAPLRLREALGVRWRRTEAAIILPDRSHQADAGGRLVAFLYLDPEDAVARGLGGARIGIRHLQPARLARPRQQLRALCESDARAEEVATACDAVLAVLQSETAPRSAPIDPRIRRVWARIRGAPDHRVRIAEAAATVGLSPGRFAHLFREQTGLPLRRYELWLRLQDALAELARGASLTAAAHAAGFADAPHMTRTFRRMLGIAPSDLTRDSTFVQAAVAPAS